MPLPEPLRLPPPRQPTPEVRAGRAYRAFSAPFVVCLTVAIALFVASFLVPRAWFWTMWASSAGVIALTVPIRAWGLRRGLLSYFVHGVAVEGTVAAVEAAGAATWRVRVRYGGTGDAGVERDFLVYDSPAAPLLPGEAVPVLHRSADPRDAVLPTLAGILEGGRAGE